MNERLMFFILSALFVLLFPDNGSSLDTKDVIQLKRAGMSDETVEIMVREKTKETCAFTVREIVQLKNAGLTEETIRMLIREGSFMKNAEPIVYGKDIQPIEFTTVRDIIELKEAGVSDEVIQAIIVSGSNDVSDRERERAWEMLTNMGLIVDLRRRR